MRRCSWRLHRSVRARGCSRTRTMRSTRRPRTLRGSCALAVRAGVPDRVPHRERVVLRTRVRGGRARADSAAGDRTSRRRGGARSPRPLGRCGAARRRDRQRRDRLHAGGGASRSARGRDRPFGRRARRRSRERATAGRRRSRVVLRGRPDRAVGRALVRRGRRESSVRPERATLPPAPIPFRSSRAGRSTADPTGWRSTGASCRRRRPRSRPGGVALLEAAPPTVDVLLALVSAAFPCGRGDRRTRLRRPRALREGRRHRSLSGIERHPEMAKYIFFTGGRREFARQGHHGGLPRAAAQSARHQRLDSETRSVHQRRRRHDEPVSARRGFRYRRRRRDRPGPGPLRALHRRKSLSAPTTSRPARSTTPSSKKSAAAITWAPPFKSSRTSPTRSRRTSSASPRPAAPRSASSRSAVRSATSSRCRSWKPSARCGTTSATRTSCTFTSRWCRTWAPPTN